MGAWLAHWLGLDNASGPIYSWWSGSGGDFIDGAAVLAGLAGLGKMAARLTRGHWQCHEASCNAIALRTWVDPMTGAHLHLCHDHHPHGPLTGEQIASRHAQASKLDSQTQPEETQ